MHILHACTQEISYPHHIYITYYIFYIYALLSKILYIYIYTHTHTIYIWIGKVLGGVGRGQVKEFEPCSVYQYRSC